MNERIKQLAEQSMGTRKHVPPVWQFFDDELQKFAELIVKECASVVAEHFDSVEPCITPKMILYHFGVKE
jgi:hypothetical protein